MRPRMMVQPHQRLPPGAQVDPSQMQGPQMGSMGPQVSGPNVPVSAPVSQNSPLLAQQLCSGGGQRPNQPNLEGQSKPEGQNEELEGLENVPNELGDLGMAEEDLLGMGDNFDILEFADALDDLDGDLDGEAKKAAVPTSGSGTTPVTSEASTSQPPPYSQAPGGISAPGQPQIRAPPPPYSAAQTTKVI